MVVGSSSASKRKGQDSAKNSVKDCLSPQRRGTKCSGVRVVGSRIYDPLNGKSCHQCRQKTMDFAATCKNQKQGKPCPIKFCHKCLLNRYGEKAEEASTLEDWHCPKCRGICNCSFCMKKRGHQPTGILIHTAKATGFSSVSQLLNVKGPKNFCNNKDAKDMTSSPKKASASKKETVMITAKKRGKENSFDGKIDSNLQSLALASNSAEKEPSEMKWEGIKVKQHGLKFNETKQTGLKQMHNSHGENGTLLKAKATSPSTCESYRKMKNHGSKVVHNCNTDDDALLRKTSPCLDERKPKEIKQEWSKRIQHSKRKDGALLKESTNKKPRISKITSDVVVKTRLHALQEEKDSKTKVAKQISLDHVKNEKKKEEGENTTCKDGEVLSRKNHNDRSQFEMAKGSCKVSKNTLNSQKDDLDFDILLPSGFELTAIAGVDLSPEDVGSALQFLEFCAAFGKVLDVKKGQPESVLREVMHGRSGRRGIYSSVVQFHIRLLSVIHEEMGEGCPTPSLTEDKTSWLHVLRKCVSESHNILDSLPLDCLERGANGYDALDPSKKLRLLNFLCDEVLGTLKIRTWIDDQNSKFVEKVKKAKGRVLAAKDKEKSLRKKMKDEIAKAIIEKNGAPLSISDHEAIVSQIKAKAAQAHAEMLESKGMIPKSDQRSDALRLEPILFDINGHAYWRLKGYSDQSDILCQHVGIGDGVMFCEKWFTFDVEQSKMVDKHICSLRARARWWP